MSAELIQTIVATAPFVVAVALLVAAAAIVVSVARAEPGGLVPRTMDPAETWR